MKSTFPELCRKFFVFLLMAVGASAAAVVRIMLMPLAILALPFLALWRIITWRIKMIRIRKSERGLVKPGSSAQVRTLSAYAPQRKAA